MTMARCLSLLLTLTTLVLLVEAGSAPSEETGTGHQCAAVPPAAEELRVKIEDLETKLSETRRETGKLRLKVYELKKELQKQTEELARSGERRTELEETERDCRTRLARAISELGSQNKENRLNRKAVVLCNGLKEQVEEDLKKVTAELEEALGAGGGKAGPPGQQEEDTGSLRDQLDNCEETVKAVRDRCDRDSHELQRIGKTHDRIRKGLENCTEKARTCEAEKEHLHFLKKGYDVVVQQLERDVQDAKDNKERSEANEKEAVRGASKYRFWLAGIAVLALTGGTIKVYSLVKEKMAERVAALAAAKQKEKLETRRKGTAVLSPSRQKKKLS